MEIEDPESNAELGGFSGTTSSEFEASSTTVGERDAIGHISRGYSKDKRTHTATGVA